MIAAGFLGELAIQVARARPPRNMTGSIAIAVRAGDETAIALLEFANGALEWFDVDDVPINATSILLIEVDDVAATLLGSVEPAVTVGGDAELARRFSEHYLRRRSGLVVRIEAAR